MPHIADPMLGLYKNLAAPLTDWLSVLLSGAERAQNAQLNLTQELLSNQSDMKRQLLDASSVHEAVDIQGKALRESWTKTMSALSDVYIAGSVSQMEWIRHNHSQQIQMLDGIASSLEDVPAEAAPMMNAMKLTIDAARSACMANLRATEEAARLATSRLENVLAEPAIVGGTRQAA